ncbi:MAG: Bug family tripartite tricarboxylate transporter substrate binding protein [bacterium]|jgi:tripartite-type tricarboxylate transporter receptor subunit TctC|nr:tripartite tricarboxylate transporter substrate binding protein [Betaproteobacteria bacterium]
MNKRLIIGSILAGLLVSGMASAQGWPNRPIRLIVPFAAGGPSDVVGREVAARLQENLGQTIVVDIRAGANSTIGATMAAKANPDGNTLLIGSVGTFAINMVNYKDPGYDSLRDFDLLSLSANTPNVLVASSKVPAANVKEVVALLRSSPGKHTFGVAGLGSSGHMTSELLMLRTKTSAIIVPFKGAGATMAAMLGGEVDLTFTSLGSAANHIRSGRLRAMAVTSGKRIAQFADVPTLTELGYKDMEILSWQGFAAPRGLPKEIFNRLESALIAVVTTGQGRTNLENLGWDIDGTTGAMFRDKLAREIKLWREVVTTAKIKID